jgi:hypothetical protein
LSALPAWIGAGRHHRHLQRVDVARDHGLQRHHDARRGLVTLAGHTEAPALAIVKRLPQQQLHD